MHKQQIKYESLVDSIIALAKRLSLFENKFNISSEDFFDKFQKGQMEDSVDFTEWSNDYKNFIELKLDLEKHLNHAA